MPRDKTHSAFLYLRFSKYVPPDKTRSIFLYFRFSKSNLNSAAPKNRDVFYWRRLTLIHRDHVTHLCVGNLTIIGSGNCLSPVRRQAIIGTNAGILLIRTSGTNFSEISSEIHTFSFKKRRLKMSSGKWRPFLSRPQCVNPIWHT